MWVFSKTQLHLLLIKEVFFCFLSLLHQRTDDEALVRLLQTTLFLVASPILVKSMFFSFRSSLTLSTQIFLYLPLLLFPFTCLCKAAIGSLSPAIRYFISIFVYLPLSRPSHPRQPYDTPYNPLQLVQEYLQLSCGVQGPDVPCAHAHLFAPYAYYS